MGDDDERRDGDRRSDLKPSETMQAGPGGQVPFSDMLRLMDQFHAADKDLEKKVEAVEERRRDTDSELYEKIEDATKIITKLETEFENLKGKDEFGDVPWYFRPAWVKSFGLAIAAVIVALAVAFGLRGPPPPPKAAPKPPANPEAGEAPEDGTPDVTWSVESDEPPE